MGPATVLDEGEEHDFQFRPRLLQQTELKQRAAEADAMEASLAGPKGLRHKAGGNG